MLIVITTEIIGTYLVGRLIGILQELKIEDYDGGGLFFYFCFANFSMTSLELYFTF